MGWTVRLLACSLAALVVGADVAGAETSGFTNPSIGGVRLDYCRHFGTACGKPAADLFCQEVGFAEALSFSISEDIGRDRIPTLVFGDGALCQGPDCDGFSEIVCTRPDIRAAPIQPPPLQPPATAVVPVAPPPAQSPPAVLTTPIAPQPPPAVSTMPVVPQAQPPTLVLPRIPLPQLRPVRPAERATVPTLTPTRPGLSATAVDLIMAMPEGASLYRCLRSDCEFALSADLEIDPGATYQGGDFGGDVSKIDRAVGFRWQVTASPFPEFAGGESDMEPPGLVASGEEIAKNKRFFVDFKEVAAGLPPPDSFYVRILPIYGPGIALPAGQPSNVIRVYYTGEPPPQPPFKLYSTSPPNLFSVKLVSFTPPDFENPNRWGCVVITGYEEPVPPLFKTVFPLGQVCPKSYKGAGDDRITSVGEFFEWAFDSITDALDWVSKKYDQLKKLAVDIALNYTPFGLQCDLAAKAAGAGDGFCRTAAEIGVNAGMAALGLPPTIPNYNELIDKGVDAAVELAAETITEQAGFPCIGPCRDALRNGFASAADNLKKSAYTPGCTGAEEAHKHGREPLCLPPGVIAKPAPGAVYTPPVAVVAVTRLAGERDPESLFDQGCDVSVGITFSNHFPGGTVWGPFNNTKEVPGQAISGTLYEGEGSVLAEDAPYGSVQTFVFPFETAIRHQFPWTRELWLQSQFMQRDAAGPMGPDWFTLYSGATAVVSAGVGCGIQGDSRTYQMPKL